MHCSAKPRVFSDAANSSGLILEELTSCSYESSIAAARELLLSYGQFLASQPAVAGFCYGNLKSEAINLPGIYLDQQGGSILATIHGQPAGFVAWRTLTPPALVDAWELKRLWIDPPARGHGAGRSLVQAVIERARAAGKRRLLLDTQPSSMVEAHQLYLRMGFLPCAVYNGSALPGLLYMSLNL